MKTNYVLFNSIRIIRMWKINLRNNSERTIKAKAKEESNSCPRGWRQELTSSLWLSIRIKYLHAHIFLFHCGFGLVSFISIWAFCYNGTEKELPGVKGGEENLHGLLQRKTMASVHGAPALPADLYDAS